MKRHLATLAWVLSVSFLGALLMTSAACPDGELFCLVSQ